MVNWWIIYIAETIYIASSVNCLLLHHTSSALHAVPLLWGGRMMGQGVNRRQRALLMRGQEQDRVLDDQARANSRGRGFWRVRPGPGFVVCESERQGCKSVVKRVSFGGSLTGAHDQWRCLSSSIHKKMMKAFLNEKRNKSNPPRTDWIENMEPGGLHHPVNTYFCFDWTACAWLTEVKSPSPQDGQAYMHPCPIWSSVHKCAYNMI